MSKKAALIGLHAFTGNDFASSFFRKSKRKCWNVIRNNPTYFNAFAELGTEWFPSEILQNKLERFVCLLYSQQKMKIQNVNELRYALYKKKFEVKGKIIDLSLLPPCLDSLKLHMLRAFFIARRYRLSGERVIDEPNMVNHGWEADGHIQWVNKSFPADIEHLLVEEDTLNVNEQEYEEVDDESDNNNDDNG